MQHLIIPPPFHTHTTPSPPPFIKQQPRVGDAKNHDAYREGDEGELCSGLVFLGLISLVDPPREGVMEAVDRCRK
jgi:magnesium-transporting ATPase (P-type)